MRCTSFTSFALGSLFHAFNLFPIASQVEGILTRMIMRVTIMLMSMHMHTHWKIFLWVCLYYVSIFQTFGIVLFFIVEKIVRYVEDNSRDGAYSVGHGHHHHHHKRHDSSDKTKSDADGKEINQTEDSTTAKVSDENHHEPKATIRKVHVTELCFGCRRSSSASSKAADGEPANSENESAPDKALSTDGSSISNSNLVFGYLNLFSDGVHNFTDGMALGSAFLLHGSVGGWSRTLFLLAHELPQEVLLIVRLSFTIVPMMFLMHSSLALLSGNVTLFVI
nr:unnamed protein product [Digitaria exilis]